MMMHYEERLSLVSYILNLLKCIELPFDYMFDLWKLKFLCLSQRFTVDLLLCITSIGVLLIILSPLMALMICLNIRNVL